MDKETREQLRRTLTMTDDKQLLKFAKSYAAKDQAFARAIIDKFLPEEETVDYEAMVSDCFLHRKKGGQRRYGSSLDWTAIRKDIKRLLKQLDYLRQQQDDGAHRSAGETAAEGALLLLETLAEEFGSDRVYEDYNYGNSNYGNRQALDIVSDVLLTDKYMSHEKKMGLLERLEKLSHDDVYSNYLSCDISKVVDKAKAQLLAPEDLLKDIDRNVSSAKYSSDKAYYVKWKIDLLRQLGRGEEAEKTIMQHLNLEDISAMRFEQLMGDSCYSQAKALCMGKIAGASDNRRAVQLWRERLLIVGQRTDDAKTVREAAKWLFTQGNVPQDDKKEYFRICRETFDGDEWPAYRDKMLSEGKKGNVSADTIFHIYAEEKLFDRMYLYLQKLSDAAAYYSYEPYSHSGGERLHFFSKYAHYLTDEQRKEMVAAFAKTIYSNSRYASSRDSYYSISIGLRLLGQSCEEGSQRARALAEQIIRENPKKPTFIEIMRHYEQ